jgi:MoxR-like ATPase
MTPEAPTLSPDTFLETAQAIRREVSSVIVGQDDAVTGALLCLIAGGHALLEGIPGVGKTRLVRAFAAALDLRFRRIQFTPDLMPADITGTNVLERDGASAGRVVFEPGPVFANLVLADEINRATPKTQSALLEAMQEGTVTTATTSRALPAPFCVLATENPIEMQGTYPLPEAQLDRFLLKLTFSFPSIDELREIVYRTAEEHEAERPAVADGATLLRMRELAHSVPMAPHVVSYAARLATALRPESPSAPAAVKEHVQLGPSPRGLQAICLAGRAAALLDGRYALAFRDIRSVAHAALRHRLILRFGAERQGVSSDHLIDGVLAEVPEEA